MTDAVSATNVDQLQLVFMIDTTEKLANAPEFIGTITITAGNNQFETVTNTTLPENTYAPDKTKTQYQAKVNILKSGTLYTFTKNAIIKVTFDGKIKGASKSTPLTLILADTSETVSYWAEKSEYYTYPAS